MITHNEVTALWWAAAMLGSGTAGFLAGRRRSERRLDDVWDAGYDQCIIDRRHVDRPLSRFPEPRKGGDHDALDDLNGVRTYEWDTGYDVPRPGSVTEQLPVANKGHTGPGRPEQHLMLARTGHAIGGSFAADGTIIDLWHRDGPDEPVVRDVAAGRTIYPELAALGAETDAERPESLPVRLDETSEQWAARMNMEAAIWCAENGVQRALEAL